LIYIYIFFSWFVGYPKLASEPGPYQVEIRWGVMKPTMDPTKESTYTFLDGFFREMSELFPDPYFHIGGDEVEGSQWTQSQSIQKFILEHQLNDKNGLQAYFNKRIQKMLKKYNKIMVGWEEILDEVNDNSTVDKDAIIQSWKSRKSLTNAIDKGYRSILSNGYYLDHLLSSIKHYKIDPILNDELWLFNEQQLSHILGGEACMWNEYVSENSIDSRIWPRILAIAERFWSPSSIDNQNFLYERLFRMNHLLDKTQTGVNHLSSYKLRLQNLIIDPDKKTNLLHPFVILADVCEPYGFDQRSQTNKYTSSVPLTTFTDALQSESELIWKLENLPIDDKKFRDMFHTWSINHLRLRQLFDDIQINKNKELWGQDIEQLSKNLAHTGQIGLRILDYGAKRILHHDKNNSMNSWPIQQWVAHHDQLLNQLENQVEEVRLAAVRPVRRLFKSLEMTIV
jgi:hexosaminidase